MYRMFVLYLCSLTLRALILAVLARLIVLGTRRIEYRHAVWTIFLFAILTMPVADALLPRALVPASVPEVMLPIQTFLVFTPQTNAVSVASDATDITRKPGIDGWLIGTAGIALVGIALAMRFLLILGTVLRLKKRSVPIDIPLPEEWGKHRSRPRLAESISVRVPLTIGFLKPVIILPSDWRTWEDWKLRTVLMHEWTHVRRRDWAIAATAGFAKSIFWFNPVVWWLERRLASLAELASDEASVRYCGNSQRYAETLLEFAGAARQGHRWIGGVAMAQHKISLRIERVLALRTPGRGVLPRTAWIALCLASVPALYASAATQQNPGELPRLSVAIPEMQYVRILDPLAVAASLPQLPQTAQRTEQSPVSVPATAAPAAPAPLEPQNPPTAPPAPVDKVNDLVEEIRLIIAPVETPQGGITLETRLAGPNRWTGIATWNITNNALSPLSWGLNNAFGFTLTGVQSRTLQFEGANGSAFSFGCSDCSFDVWENGVGTSPSPSPSIAFQLSADGGSVSVTCRAAECRIGVLGQDGVVQTPDRTFAAAVFIRSLRKSEVEVLPLRPASRVLFAVAR